MLFIIIFKHKMEDSFVYIWKNLTNNKIYIGYHKGKENDNYVCSSLSKIFWEDFNNKENKWEREIIYRGSKDECLKYEQELLKTYNLKTDLIYNNARGATIIFTKEILDKMSISHKRRWQLMSRDLRKSLADKISKSKTGVPRKQETKDKLSKLLKGKSLIEKYGFEKSQEITKKIIKANTGKKRGEEFKKEQSKRFLGTKNPMYGKKHTEEFKNSRRYYFLKNNPGKNKTQETKDKISMSKKGLKSKTKGVRRLVIKCPYCIKEGGIGIMQRWHFDNCKLNLK